MNFRRILSKSSLSSLSAKSIPHNEEIAKLQSEIDLLKQTIDSLKISVESRDAAIGTIAREKEKIYVELKSAQRTNRNLHQQLVDERDIHSKEKEYLVEEIKRITKRDEQESTLQGMNLEGGSLFQEELKSKDQIIYNICSKYLKIKSSKLQLQKKLQKLQRQSQKACEDIILLLQENRYILDSLLNKLLNISSLSTTTKKYLKLLKINANLHYENTQLKICVSTRKDLSLDTRNENIDEESEINIPPKFSKSEGGFKYICHQKDLNNKYTKRHKPGDQGNHTQQYAFGSCNYPPPPDKLYKSNSDPCLRYCLSE